MEFLKSCTTNVHLLENVAQISCNIYKGRGGVLWDGERWKLVRRALLELRRRNILCVRNWHGIWVFGEEPSVIADILGPDDLELAETTSLEAAATEPTFTDSFTRELFLKAVEAAIAFKLARQDGIKHVGAWTWVVSQDVECDSAAHDAVLLRLHAHLSSSGNMYLASETSKVTLVPCTSPRYRESDYVIMTPQGVLAQLISPDERLSANDESSKLYIRSYLETEGIHVAEDAMWNNVRPTKDAQSPAMLWPADLCLVLEPDNGDGFAGADDGLDWRPWFENDAIASFKNPLTMAEELFQDAARREQMAKESTQPEGNGNASNDSRRALVGHADSNEVENSTTTPSPLAQRSSEQQLATSGIYPTPPDGLTQATSNTQLTAENGSSTTQVDQDGTAIDLQLDMLQPHTRESIGSAFQQDYTLQGDDLFGDAAEEMELGDNAVDDADFSFFDEPDDDRNVNDLDDTNMLEIPEMEKDSDTQKVQERDISEPAIEDEDKDAANTIEHMESEEPPDQPVVEHADQPKDGPRSSPSQMQVLPLINSDFKAEKPLSPFGIRERLLPPPVPASVAQMDPALSQERRRSSCFAPVKFNEGLNLTRKYAGSDLIMRELHDETADHQTFNIGLPKRKKYRQPRQRFHNQRDSSDDDSDSEEDSSESSSMSEKEPELPPRLPWETKKRKRYPDLDPATPLSGVYEQPFSDAGVDDGQNTTVPDYMLLDTLETSSSHNQYLDKLRSARRFSTYGSPTNSLSRPDSGFDPDQLPRIEDVFDLGKQDLIYISQITSEQSISVLIPSTHKLDMLETLLNDGTDTTASVHASIDKCLLSIFPAMERCDLSHVALVREPPTRQLSSGKPPQGQPRPLQRSDSLVIGPDYFAIPPSYVRIQRGMDNWEMLPTCLSFWESLGLGPAGGPKNIAAWCVLPSNSSLQRLVEQFMIDLGAAYENCKLGTHIHGHRNDTDSKSAKHDLYESGMASVELGAAATLEGALRAYASTCVNLGKALAHVGQLETDRNIVVYMLHPFDGPRATQLLCACFWMLFKTYRDSMAKLHRSQGCDVVLQLLPIQHVASFDALVTPKAKDMAMLAREVYDRCPPSPVRAPETASALPILVAPSVALASPAPKKIGFQLCVDAPRDLLHEGSNLHLAYGVSADGQWLTAAWIDNIGQHFAATSYCLRGRSFAEIAAEVWERTRDIIAARQVMWRVFIITPGTIDKSISQCWRALCVKPRQQPLCITLLTAQMDPCLQLMPPSLIHESFNTGLSQDSNLFTPASTPQGATFTNSPDVSSHTNAPPTPAPSETAATVAENDPDAYLTDVTDDAWAMLLSPKLSTLFTNQGLANGLLLKRGDDDGAGNGLPSLGLSLMWAIQVKPNGGVDEGNVRFCELTLREVLRIYRNLAILTKARGLDNGKTTVVPLHIATVLRAVRHLDGMLSPS